MSNDSDRHKLLAVVTAIHHEGVGETLDDGALRLSEPLFGVTAGRVGDVNRCADLNVIPRSRDQPLFEHLCQLGSLQRHSC